MATPSTQPAKPENKKSPIALTPCDHISSLASPILSWIHLLLPVGFRPSWHPVLLHGWNSQPEHQLATINSAVQSILSKIHFCSCPVSLVKSLSPSCLQKNVQVICQARKPLMILWYLPRLPIEHPTLKLHKTTSDSQDQSWLFTRSYSVPAVPTAWWTPMHTSEPFVNITCSSMKCSPTLHPFQICHSILFATDILWTQLSCKTCIRHLMPYNSMTCLYIFLPTLLGKPQVKNAYPLPRTCTCLDKQLVRFLELEEGPAMWEVSPGCTQTGCEGKEGVNGWTFKTLWLVTLDLNFILTQLATEKAFSSQILFPPSFLKTSPYQFESCKLFLSQKEFPFKQKLFRHFQDTKCEKPGFSTQTTRKLFANFFFPRLLLFAKESEEIF